MENGMCKDMEVGKDLTVHTVEKKKTEMLCHLCSQFFLKPLLLFHIRNTQEMKDSTEPFSL